jgi:EAL domain-containing protein (putative c-di-GMP-specific phosphodiesterase class I)
MHSAGEATSGWGVNLSPLQFQAPDLAETVRRILAEQQFNPQRLEIEITEGVLLRDHASTHATLQALKALGVSIAMDDFGTGYSSLGHLRRFPFDRIKIDRSFISDLVQDAHAQAIVRSIIALAGTLSMPVIAEGVETAEQAMLLLREGCREAQGYHFGKPMPAEAIAELLASPAAAA